MTDELHSDAVEGGNYDVIRARLDALGTSMRDAAQALNAQRQEVFGSTRFELIGHERVRTENNCVPRDIVQVRGALLFGYNVFLGLKRQTTPDDVFSLQQFRHDGTAIAFEPVTDPGLRDFLEDRSFKREFDELYQYYKDARLLQLRVTESKLLAVFQTGATARDVKVLRWAVDPGGRVTYVDNRGERDHVFPATHDFAWTDTSRTDHVLGRHPHVNVLDTVFVETVGGDLTVKVEDNTADGQGIYREPVDDPNQSLDDAEIRYARRGSLILLSVLPFRETTRRFLVFNTETRSVVRIDAIGQSCVSLPEDHGILFPGGYYLATGAHKLFEGDTDDLEFVRAIRAPNGEDVLYVFHRRTDGLYALYPYNLVTQAIETPIQAHGWSLFDDGTLVVFRATDEPARVHPMQVWRTPFVSAEVHEQTPSDGSLLARIGNKDLVRGVSDALTIAKRVVEQTPTRQVYEELAAACRRFMDGYGWAGRAEVGDLRSVADQIRLTAERILDEFDKVQQLRARANAALTEAKAAHARLLTDARPDTLDRIEDFLDAMTRLRSHRGELIARREVRYVDLDALDALEAETVAAFDRVSQATVTYLQGGDAFAPLQRRLGELEGRIAGVHRAAELVAPTEALDTVSAGVDLLGEVIAGLEVDDPTIKTGILDDISEVVAATNRVRALLDQRRATLRRGEGEAEFAAQLKLYGQAVASALGRCTTPEATDDQLSRLLLQLEEIEARFGDHEAFLPQLAEQREEVYAAFGSRKQALIDERQRRVGAVVGAADRILQGIARRATTFEDEVALQAWFAADPMVLKLRGLIDQLAGLGDVVKADELRSRLTRARQDALRGLRDALDLYDGDLITLGKHKFTVNTQPLELTLVPHGEEGLALHLLGTDFREPVDDPALEATRPFWQQAVVSETPELYRAEFLACRILDDAEAGREGLTPARLDAAVLAHDELLAVVREAAARRYDEGYDRGVHDVDAARVLAAVVALRRTAGLLRFPPDARALAMLFWAFDEDARRTGWVGRARSLLALRALSGPSLALTALRDELEAALAAWREAHGLALSADLGLAADYLVEVLGREAPRFVVRGVAQQASDALDRWLEDHGGVGHHEDLLRPLGDRWPARVEVWTAWLTGLTQAGGVIEADAAVEAAAWRVASRVVDVEVDPGSGETVVDGLLGRHPRVVDGRLTLRLDDLLSRVAHHRRVVVPGFAAWRAARSAWLTAARERLRIDELQPRVMSSFVRNKLIQDAYLPLIGDNLAKQLGAAGEGKRTDLMGLLLLVSPPGYGKTTLMEYTASRLGLTFVKVNGPALGHDVTSLDPAEAPNATARQEVDRINLALELGNNVMLYLDDIQHCHPELLQKFISLCDAQRRIEGVWHGRTRTYDLRGKKFCVVMAGNPYTESGDAFQIPDMLANRADTYNLGDILGGHQRAFALSFVENALTSSRVLQPLANRSQDDVYLLVRMAEGEEIPTTELSHDYGAVELADLLATLRHLFRCRDVLLQVNATYVASAAMEDAFRTEPRFQLQGSYRNMNKLAEKLVPAMTEAEVEALIDDHYRSEAQTLTTGAEANLLKLAELRGRLSDAQAARWTQIRAEFRRQQLVGGGDDDPATRITGVLSSVTEAIAALGGRLDGGSAREGMGRIEEALGGVATALRTQRGVELGPVVDALGRVEGALAQRDPDAASAVVEALGRIEGRLGEDGTRLIAQALTRLTAAWEPRTPEPVVDALVGIRDALAAGRPPASTAQEARAIDAEIPADLRDVAGDLARARDTLLVQAQRAVDLDNGPGAVEPSADRTLAVAVSVVELVAVQLSQAAKRFIPERDRAAFYREAKAAVAQAVSAIAREHEPHGAAPSEG